MYRYIDTGEEFPVEVSPDGKELIQSTLNAHFIRTQSNRVMSMYTMTIMFVWFLNQGKT